MEVEKHKVLCKGTNNFKKMASGVDMSGGSCYSLDNGSDASGVVGGL